MPPESGIILSLERVNELRSFMKECHAKREYRRVSAIVMRAGSSSVRDVAAIHGVSEKTVSVWTAAYMRKGIAGLKNRKRKRVLSSNGRAARKRIPQLLCHEPVEFSIWRGRWTIGGMAMQLEKEGMRVSASTVRRALIEKKCVWKRPKLRAPGSVKKDYRKRKIVENYKSIAPALRSRGVGVFFEDEKWIELLARLESVWMRKGTEMFVPTPGYAARWNFFISLDYATGSIVWNSSPRRRNVEFRRHLSAVAAYCKRKKLKKAILFIDRASYHGTDEVRRFLDRHTEIVVKSLPKKDPNVNPVELLVNRRMSSFVQSNRCYYSRDELRDAGSAFLSSYNAVYAAG